MLIAVMLLPFLFDRLSNVSSVCLFWGFFAGPLDFGWSQQLRFQFLASSIIRVIPNIIQRRMVKYFCSSIDIRSTWEHVVSAFWQRYPNPYRYVIDSCC